jgi:hypothetical protein
LVSKAFKLRYEPVYSRDDAGGIILKKARARAELAQSAQRTFGRTIEYSIADNYSCQVAAREAGGAGCRALCVPCGKLLQIWLKLWPVKLALWQGNENARLLSL